MSSSGQGNMNPGDMNQGDMNPMGTPMQGNTGSAASMSSATTTQMSGDSAQNLQYDLISTIYHAHKSASSIQQYISDANASSNDQAAQFFQMIAQEDQQRAQRAQDLLMQLGGSSMSGMAH